MNKPVAPGRIRWAVACLAIAASALVPAAAEARALRVEVIVQMDAGHRAAEGIETAEQVEALRVLQSSFGQGFYLARPEAARTSVQARSSAPESGRYRS